jgi:uncharacterized protein (TIGR02271 family)
MRGERSLQAAVRQLRAVLAEISNNPDPDLAAMLAAKPAVLARFQPLFAPERIPSLTAEAFQAFLLFKHNCHWVGLHPQGPWLCADLPALRQALALLVDESRPLRDRLDRLAPQGEAPLVPRLGRAVLTAILHIVSPDKYGVWNGISEVGLKTVRAWPPFGRRASLGERYVAINDILLALARALHVDLWTLDTLWWRVKGPRQPGPDGSLRDQRGCRRRGTVAKRVVGLFADCSGAERAVQKLLSNGFARAELSLVVNDTRGEPVTTVQEGVGLGAVADELLSALAEAAIAEEEATDYGEGVRRGGILLIVTTTEDKAGHAEAILRRHEAGDLAVRVAQGQERGWTGPPPAAEPSTAADLTRGHDPARTCPPEAALPGEGAPDPLRPAAGEEVTIPVMEEEVEVNKRAVQRGGVRVSSRVTETPVEETVRLREEQVSVERRPVERPASETDLAAFQEGTIEVTQTVEEPVLSKQVRVVEEVVVRKDVEERTETVQETVRRTDVEVEPWGAAGQGRARGGSGAATKPAGTKRPAVRKSKTHKS